MEDDKLRILSSGYRIEDLDFKLIEFSWFFFLFYIYFSFSFSFLFFCLFLDNAGVIVNPKGEMKGSAVTGPIAKGQCWIMEYGGGRL